MYTEEVFTAYLRFTLVGVFYLVALPKETGCPCHSSELRLVLGPPGQPAVTLPAVCPRKLSFYTWPS